VVAASVRVVDDEMRDVPRDGQTLGELVMRGNIVMATFELQNAGLAAAVALFEATTTSERALLKEWDAHARKVQKASLEAFQAQVRAAARLSEQAEPSTTR
jgi:hypothetical protein